MQARRPIPLLAALGALAGLAICSCSGGLQQSASERMDQLAAFSPRDLLPLKVPIVKVRPGDLQDLPLGSERAMAYNRKRSFPLLGPHASFVEPLLPENSEAESTFGVLPARPQ